MKPIFIDCDTGVDDALAILAALQSPQVEVLGISTVAGNVEADAAFRNTLAVLELVSADSIPVAKGMEAPLTRILTTAKEVHGESGLGNLTLPDVAGKGLTEHGVDFLIRTVKQSDRPVTLVLLGPLTNMAVALKKDPSIADHIAELVIMGGADAAGGNVTPVAEFNIYVDPEAARIVLESGLPIRLVTWDVCLDAWLTEAELKELEQSAEPAANVAHELIQFLRTLYNKDNSALSDPAAMCALLDESVIESESLPIEVETAGTVTRGMTVIDTRPFATAPVASDTRPRVQVARKLYRERFAAVFMNALMRK